MTLLEALKRLYNTYRGRRRPVEPPKPVLRGVTIHLFNTQGERINGDVTLNNQTFGVGIGGGRLDTIEDCPVPLTVKVTAEGYFPYEGTYTESCGEIELRVTLAKIPEPPKPIPAPWPPAKSRAPLPPHNPDTFETADPNVDPTWHRVYTVLPPVPWEPLVDWWRGDAWGVTVPGLPPVEGGARPGSPAESRVLTYFLGRYERAQKGMEATILAAHKAAGYTHFSLSPQDEFAQGMSEDQYVEMAKRVKEAGFFVHHLFLSKYYTDSTNPDLSQTFRLIDKLDAVGALDVVTPAWEGNFMQPDVLRRVITEVTNKVAGRALVMLHFFPHYISWQANNESPGGWWNELINLGVDGVLYQGDPAWTMGMLSARIEDCLKRLVGGGMWGLSKTLIFVAWEDQATNQYNNGYTANGRLADEAEGNLRGYEAVCVRGPMYVRGYGNGGRRMDGSVL